MVVGFELQHFGREEARPPSKILQKFSNDFSVISTVHGVVFDLAKAGRPA
ncbi:hypothetical protein IQ17_04638 [Bradyrhizobium daqingense]|uniref:Uncharacterized protein n=1 Tax=Bradyrhizobium daqingense TaxID=993502 RepID=A0A562L1N6_9BRAD|nr:hypothetical protein IQ17_04638 [Bradyrhizobium daqingense]